MELGVIYIHNYYCRQFEKVHQNILNIYDIRRYYIIIKCKNVFCIYKIYMKILLRVNIIFKNFCTFLSKNNCDYEKYSVYFVNIFSYN